MKRKITALFFALLIALSLTGVGCSSAQTLVFEKNFCGDLSPVPGYSEKLTYDLSYDASNRFFQKDENIGDNLATAKYTGTYVSELNVLASCDKQTDIKANETEFYYRLSTALNVDVEYTLNGSETVSHKDSIVSEVYFLGSERSFAPIYSKTTSDYTNLKIAEKASCYSIKSQSEIIYNQKSYSVSIKHGEADFGTDFSIDDKDYTVSEYQYSYRTAIDNAQLLFALRGVGGFSEKTTSVALPTISPAYGEYKTLSVINKNDGFEATGIKLKYNGEELTANIILRELSFNISSSNTSGKEQIVQIQKEKTTGLPFNGLLYRYAEPLIAYGSFSSFGALVYTLSEVEINNV